jgi:hypothetical protein
VLGGLTARVDRWLAGFAIAGLEVGTLATPVVLLLLLVSRAESVPLPALSALVATSAAVATMRGRDTRRVRWPAPAHAVTIPIRAAYYGATVALATRLGLHARTIGSSPWPAVVVPAIVCAVALVPFTRVLAALRSLACWGRRRP